jgi:hypothetical protein
LGIASLARDDLPAHWVPAFIAQKHDADLVDVGRQPCVPQKLGTKSNRPQISSEFLG